ncbi:hypothetical protein FVA77_09235 [Phyllobacterium endophyticum]|nr:hypothetical protein FVA77_09235 [Phyllobacterium endophyticum]
MALKTGIRMTRHPHRPIRIIWCCPTLRLLSAECGDQHGHLSIAKFPEVTDDYSMETWEEIAHHREEFRCLASFGALSGPRQLAPSGHEPVDLFGEQLSSCPQDPW